MNLEVLIRKRDYYDEKSPQWVRNIWSRKESFNNFIKYNRQSLVEQGAVVKIGRDYFVDVEKFPTIARQVIGVAPDESVQSIALSNGGDQMKS